MFADRSVGLRMDEIGERKEHLVVSSPFLELLFDDLEVSEARDPGACHDHCFGAPADKGSYVLIKDSEHDLGLVLDKTVILKRHVLERLGHDTFRVELFLVRRRQNPTMQVI